MLLFNKLISGKSIFFVFFLFSLFSVNALEFSILNKGDIIFQEIFIESGDQENNYYHNFGIQGLEPGARHNINIYSSNELLFCSFYLYGISQESYIIENVAIEESSIVYILPEHYQEMNDEYTDIDDPDAVYGARFFDREKIIESQRPFGEAPELLNEDSLAPRNPVNLEVFNYTNSSIFRVYLQSPLSEYQSENLLDGQVLMPSESITLHMDLEENLEYTMTLKGQEGQDFTKTVIYPLKADFLVFNDSDLLNQMELQQISLKNGTEEELIEIYLIDPAESRRVELLEGDIFSPGSTMDFILDDYYGLCDLMARTSARKKIYLFDLNLNENRLLIIREDE